MRCTRPHDLRYLVNGILLDDALSVRDLGVNVKPNLPYREHILDVARSASMIYILIRRFFINERQDLYFMLFRSVVLSKFTYCSLIRTPYLAQDKASLESVQKRLLRFVVQRCKVDISQLSLQTVESSHTQVDFNTFHRIVRSGKTSHFFRVSENVRRTRRIYAGQDVRIVA